MTEILADYPAFKQASEVKACMRYVTYMYYTLHDCRLWLSLGEV